MSRQIRTEREGGEAPPAPHSAVREPQTTEEARRAIERTRDRISATLDEIGGRLDGTRKEIGARVDVTRRLRAWLRRHPVSGVGLLFGAGLVLGLLTGGGETLRVGVVRLRR